MPRLDLSQPRVAEDLPVGGAQVRIDGDVVPADWWLGRIPRVFDRQESALVEREVAAGCWFLGLGERLSCARAGHVGDPDRICKRRDLHLTPKVQRVATIRIALRGAVESVDEERRLDLDDVTLLGSGNRDACR